MNNIPSFNGLRFIIIIFLILHHFDTFNDLNISGMEKYMSYFTEGFLSVNFFFLLSGFCISYGYYDKLRFNIINSKDFIIKRIIHLWPIHFLFLILALLVQHDVTFTNIINLRFFTNLFLLQSFIPSIEYFFSYNALSWAVSNELFYYILFIILAFTNVKKQVFICILLWSIILLNIIVAYQGGRADTYFFYINPIFRFGDFLLGVMLFHLYKAEFMIFKIKQYANLLEILTILFLMIAIYLGSKCEIWLLKWQIWYTLACIPLIYVFSVSSGVISVILSNRFFSYLGSIAYPLYLSHQIILLLLKKIFINYLVDYTDVLLLGFTGIFTSIIISIIIKEYIIDKLNEQIQKMYNNIHASL